jgi:RNase P subunit RPR2
MKMRKKPDEKILREINNLFSEAKTNPEEAAQYIKKARELAKRNNLSLRSYRKLFCKKCNSYFTAKNSITRIKKGIKSIKCLKCGSYRRFRVK